MAAVGTTQTAMRSSLAGSGWGRILDWPLHPFLFPVYLIVTSATVNADEVAPANFGRIAAAMLLVMTAAIGIAWLALKGGRQAGVLATLTYVGLFLYGWALPIESGLMLWDHLLVPTWAAVFGALLVVLVMHRGSLAFFTRALNIATGVMAASAVTAGVSRLQDTPSPLMLPEIPASQLAMDGNAGAGGAERPDIYYLIFDRYGAGRTLASAYGHDNSGFLDRLRGAGFYVAEDSAANYTKTGLSLASSLNLQHLDSLLPQQGRRSDWRPIYALLTDTRAWRFLKSRGYRYTHVGSWWGATRRNDSADRNVEETVSILGLSIAPTTIEWFFIDRTLLSRAADLFVPVSSFARSHDGLARQLAALRDIRREEGPNFVFAHILVPHPPFVFERSGEYKPLEKAVTLSRERNYIDQLVYINGEIERLVGELLSRPGPKPVIILQADEGPYPERYAMDHGSFDWRTATDEEMRQKFRILNALYLPGNSYASLYPSISPVNTFRVIFNEYFGQHLPLLPDTTYTFATEADIYSLYDITDVVR